MAKILDREALIKTAMVEIKALTVSGKQVTLALFRQLQEEGLIGEEPLMTTQRLADLLELSYRTCLRYLQELEEWGQITHHDMPAGDHGGRPLMGWILLQRQ